eukprot:gene988-1106_t
MKKHSNVYDKGTPRWIATSCCTLMAFAHSVFGARSDVREENINGAGSGTKRDDDDRARKKTSIEYRIADVQKRTEMIQNVLPDKLAYGFFSEANDIGLDTGVLERRVFSNDEGIESLFAKHGQLLAGFTRTLDMVNVNSMAMRSLMKVFDSTDAAKDSQRNQTVVTNAIPAQLHRQRDTRTGQKNNSKPATSRSRYGKLKKKEHVLPTTKRRQSSFSTVGNKDVDAYRVILLETPRAEGGDVKSMYNVAVAYWTFYEGSMENFTQMTKHHCISQCLRWVRNAAECDYCPAMYALAQHYEHGRGVATNLNGALKWYSKLARSSSPRGSRKDAERRGLAAFRAAKMLYDGCDEAKIAQDKHGAVGLLQVQLEYRDKKSMHSESVYQCLARMEMWEGIQFMIDIGVPITPLDWERIPDLKFFDDSGEQIQECPICIEKEFQTKILEPQFVTMHQLTGFSSDSTATDSDPEPAIYTETLTFVRDFDHGWGGFEHLLPIHKFVEWVEKHLGEATVEWVKQHSKYGFNVHLEPLLESHLLPEVKRPAAQKWVREDSVKFDVGQAPSLDMVKSEPRFIDVISQSESFFPLHIHPSISGVPSGLQEFTGRYVVSIEEMFQVNSIDLLDVFFNSGKLQLRQKKTKLKDGEPGNYVLEFVGLVEIDRRRYVKSGVAIKEINGESVRDILLAYAFDQIKADVKDAIVAKFMVIRNFDVTSQQAFNELVGMLEAGPMDTLKLTKDFQVPNGRMIKAPSYITSINGKSVAELMKVVNMDGLFTAPNDSKNHVLTILCEAVVRAVAPFLYGENVDDIIRAASHPTLDDLSRKNVDDIIRAVSHRTLTNRVHAAIKLFAMEPQKHDTTDEIIFEPLSFKTYEPFAFLCHQQPVKDRTEFHAGDIITKILDVNMMDKKWHRFEIHADRTKILNVNMMDDKWNLFQEMYAGRERYAFPVTVERPGGLVSFWLCNKRIENRYENMKKEGLLASLQENPKNGTVVFNVDFFGFNSGDIIVTINDIAITKLVQIRNYFHRDLFVVCDRPRHKLHERCLRNHIRTQVRRNLTPSCPLCRKTEVRDPNLKAQYGWRERQVKNAPPVEHPRPDPEASQAVKEPCQPAAKSEFDVYATFPLPWQQKTVASEPAAQNIDKTSPKALYQSRDDISSLEEIPIENLE